MKAIDQANDDLGWQAEDEAVVRERSLRWVEILAPLGVTDANVAAVFQRATLDKTDRFRLSILDLQNAVPRVVAGQRAQPRVEPLPDHDCLFLLTMISIWHAQDTEASRAYLRGLRADFIAHTTTEHTTTEHERAVLTALKALDLGESDCNA